MSSKSSSVFGMTVSDLATHLGIIGIAMLLLAPGLIARADVGGIGTTICIVGAAATALLAVFAYLFARRRGDTTAPRPRAREWVVKRGVPYVLTQAPVIAIFAGFFFRVVPFGLAAIGVIGAFFALFVWVAYRRSVSDDPDEPVHHLARYALWAVVPCVAFSIARIPTHLGFGFAYWHPWYDFGNDLTGLPPHHYPSLLAGALLYTLDGLVLTIGYYILFQKRSLANAILYICLYISSIYCFTFPAYARIGMQSPPAWHAVVYWAHLVMAVAAWYMPRFFERTWPRLRALGRTASLIAIASSVVAPYAYAMVQAHELQWPKQQRIDAELFARRDLLTASDRIAVDVAGDEAHYELAMQLGPRSYKNWVNRTRVLDVHDIAVTGRIVRDGRPIAWCTAYIAELPRLNEAAFDADFVARVRAHDTTQIALRCTGPSSAVRDAGSDTATIEWRASALLIGDRASARRTFEGARRLRLTARSIVAAVN
jgi:hypothetical protein